MEKAALEKAAPATELSEDDVANGDSGAVSPKQKKQDRQRRIAATIESLLFHRPKPKKTRQKKKKKTRELPERGEDYRADTLPWVEKYRPKRLDDVSSHQAIIETIRGMVKTNTLPHMLLYGPPGTGKTSTILACANEMYGERVDDMVLEINASDDNSINVVREQVKVFASTQQLYSSGVKLIIMDEAEELSSEAQAALKRVVEQYSSSVRFCFICNFMDKVIPAIRSRCTRFRFPPLPAAHVRQKMAEVVAAEKLVIDAGGEAGILRIGRGDMRRVLNTMQACHLAQKDVVTEDVVYEVTGYPSPKDMAVVAKALLTRAFKPAHDEVAALLVDKGLSLVDVVTELGELAVQPDFTLYTGVAKPAPVMSYLTKRLADIEYALADAASDELQLGGVVAAFVLARHLCS